MFLGLFNSMGNSSTGVGTVNNGSNSSALKMRRIITTETVS